MDDLSIHLKTVFRITLFFLSACLLFWGFFPAYRGYATGVMLGTAVSWINARYLSLKVKHIAEQAVKGTGRRVNLGFMTRAAMAVLAAIVAIRSDQIELAAVIPALIFVQLATLVVGLYVTLSGKG